MAARYGRDDVVTFLLDHVTEKMPQTAVGWSPLHFSSGYGRLNATKILLDAIGNNSSYINQHSNETDNYYTPLHYAAAVGQTPIVKLFLDRIVGNKNPKAAFTHYVSVFLSFFLQRLAFSTFFFVIVEVTRWLNVVMFLVKFQSFQSKIVDSPSTGFM